MSLRDYIPEPEEINRCIKPEAEGASEAVLLAVHQPTPISYRPITGQERIQTSEGELLDHLLTPNVPTGALVVPITGASGVGKSHLVRIIDARLRRARGAERYVICRIPKSASLRRVVELILELLPGERYEHAKEAFRNALAEVEVESAAIRFGGELEIALRDKAAQLEEMARANPTQTLREQFDHARRLPFLLTDPVIAPHFRERVFPRIVRRAVSGVHSEAIDANEGQFAASDLDLPGSIDLGQAARPASSYYRTALRAREGHGLVVAAAVLNMVVDQATRQLFSLQGSLGGMTLQDVILEVRRLLLKEGRELVLLVEDFAALTGIQETLAKVLIQEGVRDGVTQIATMRSVIAVTDGYLLSRDTLATRAMREWIVESRIQSRDEVFSLTRALVASYLNAARLGEAALIARYSRQGRSEATEREWLPTFQRDLDSDSSRLLDAFGYEAGIPLFPFTHQAIDYLATRALTSGEGVVFNPRFIINDVLRRLLLPASSAFEAKRFPPALPDLHASAEVAQAVAKLDAPESTRERYQRVVVIWGNNPQIWKQVASIRGEVFEAFGLPVPRISAEPPGPEPKQPPPEEPKLKVPRKAKSGDSQEISEYRATLEAWVRGTALPQTVANAIRKALAGALNDAIDWNAERMLKTAIEPTQVSIPSSSGEGRVFANAVKLAESNQDTDGRLRSELLSLLRTTHVFAGQSDYEEFEDDVARVANLVNRLLPQAIALVRARNSERLQQAILMLRANSDALGRSERAVTVRGLRASILAEVDDIEALPDDAPSTFRDWRSLQSQISGIRPRLKEVLVSTCGCFQGTGETPYGLDIVKVLDNHPAPELKIDLQAVEGLSQNERQALANMSAQRIGARLRAMSADLVRLREKIDEWCGPTFDANELATSVKELAEDLKTAGAWESEKIGVSHPEFLRLAESFRTGAVRDSLEKSRSGVDVPGIDAESTGKQIAALGNLKLGPILLAHRFAGVSVAIVKAANQQAALLETQSGGVTPAEQGVAIVKLFDDLLGQLSLLEAGEDNAAR